VLENNPRTGKAILCSSTASAKMKHYGSRGVMYNWFASNSKFQPELFCVQSSQYVHRRKDLVELCPLT